MNPGNSSETSEMPETFIEQKIAYWKNKLIDLSQRNSLISYRFTKSKSIKIVSPSLKKIFNDLSNEETIYLLRKEEYLIDYYFLFFSAARWARPLKF